MQKPPLPDNETQRLQVLQQLGVLDTVAEERFDRLTRLAKRLCDVPIALVTLVDADRQWFKSRQGLDTCETGRDISFCGHAILQTAIFEVSDAKKDERFVDNPLVTGAPHIRFYAGAPLFSNEGYALGTLCIIDSAPRVLTAEQKLTLRDLADVVAAELTTLGQHKTYAALAESQHLTRVIARVQEKFIGDVDRRAAFDALLADILALTKSEYGFIGEVLHKADDTPYLKTYAITNIAWNDETRAFYDAHAQQGMEFGNLKTLFGAALTSGEPVIANDPYQDPRRGGLPEGHPALNAFLCMPVYHGDELVALVGVANRPGGYQQSLIGFLHPLLLSLGQLVDAARVRQKEKESQLMLARLSQVASQTTNGVIITDSKGHVEWINDGFTRITGYVLNDLLGRKPGDVLQGPGTDPATVAQISEALATGEGFDAELINYTKDGKPYWIRIRCNPLRDFNGVIEGFMAIESDITLDVRAAERLRESEQQFRTLVNNIPGTTYRCLWDEHWTMRYISEKVELLSGYPAIDFINNAVRTYASVIHPDDRKGCDDAVAKAIDGSGEWLIEYRILHRDGRTRWAQERGFVVRAFAGRVHYLDGFILDITEDKQNREQAQRQLKAFTVLNSIAATVSSDLDEQIRLALQLGADFLELELGIVSRIKGDDYEVKTFVAPPGIALECGQHFSLMQTYCALTFAQNDLVAIQHMGNSEHRGHPCYQHFELESYIGVTLQVNGKPYGTLNFSSARPRTASFDDGERMFVRLLGRWVAATLERELSHQQLKKLTSQVPGMVYQYQQWPDGRAAFPYSSPGIKEIYGVTPEVVHDDAGPVLRILHPDDLEMVAQSVEQSRLDRSHWHLQYRTLQDNGRVRWLEGNATPESMDDGSTLWHGYIQDITDAKGSELAIEASEARLRGLFEMSPLGIALNDYETGVFIDLNESLLRPSGYSREEFVALSYWELTPPEYKVQEAQQLEAMKKTGRYGPYEKEYLRKDGSRYPVLLNGVVVYDVSGRKLIWSIVEDISERKRMERMKDEFVSTVSHELRTPLTSIHGVLDILASGKLGGFSEQARRMIDIAYKNSKRLELLINDLLDMEKLVAGKMRFEIRDQLLFPLLKEAVYENQEYADRHGVFLMLDTCDLGYRVGVDADRLQQVLANLLSNATKFSPQGAQVVISTSIHEGGVRVAVRDNGPGIPASFHDRIFQKFAQADSSDTRQQGGTGLGLAISRELIERMGGSIGFASTEGEGATFWFELPLAGHDRSEHGFVGANNERG